MCRTLIQLSQLRQQFPGVLFLHGITRKGGESEVPPDATFVDRITNAIRDSNETKLSSHSFSFRVNGRPHLWSTFGTILREGDVIAADPDDTGLRKDTLAQIAARPNPDFQIVLDPNRGQYNELVVQHAVPIGIFIWWQFDGQFPPLDVHSASLTLGYPVFVLAEQGLFRTEWNAIAQAFDVLPNGPVNLRGLFA
jgi:hypothetical protein